MGIKVGFVLSTVFWGLLIGFRVKGLGFRGGSEL